MQADYSHHDAWAPPPHIVSRFLLVVVPVGTGIETLDGSVVFLTPNEGAFVREATYTSSDTSGMNDARALPRFFLSFARNCVTVGVGDTFPRFQRAFRAITVRTSQQARRTRRVWDSITFVRVDNALDAPS
jgi:hypothetical protein